MIEKTKQEENDYYRNSAPRSHGILLVIFRDILVNH